MEINIQIESTPNPHALKFVVNHPIQYKGSSTFVSADECAQIPLAKKLFQLPGVISVFLMDHFVTISKQAGSDWDSLVDQVKKVILDSLPDHDPAIIPQKKDFSKLSSTDRLMEIEAIIDTQIRPGLAADGGGIEILSMEGVVLKVKYQGACGSCPSSKTGTLMAIQDLLRRSFDPTIEVQADDADSPDLFSFDSLFKNHQ